MPPSADSWQFVGRRTELRQLASVLARGRWFFVKLTGRRRIGKTTLVRQAVELSNQPVLYVQLPDSGDAGVLSQVADAMDTFKIPAERYPRPHSMSDLAQTIEALARGGYVVILDEFQYFNRKLFTEFCSLLQAAVDRCTAESSSIRGGLIVLGSIHTEMAALLENRSAPLYNRVTDDIELGHLDIESLLVILTTYSVPTPEQLLFLWTLFEGVPKFYRDAHEQGVLQSDRSLLLKRLFFESSSPLRAEADTWFLRELRGRYDMILKFVARKPGRRHNELVEEIQQVGGVGSDKLGGYLKTLTERYRLIERRRPIFANENSRQSRYYLKDNFLQSWLAALSNQVSARDFRPLDELVAEADERMAEVEGFALERLAATLYQERSRKSIGDFPVSKRIEGYWDRGSIEIDLVMVSRKRQVIRLGSCKRNAGKLVADINQFKGYVERYLIQKPLPTGYRAELVAIAPRITADQRNVLERHGLLAEDLIDLTTGLGDTPRLG